MLPFAQARGIRVLFVDRPRSSPRAVGNSAAAAGQFAAFTAHVARTFPTVKDIIVGNEPNQTRFWQPQYNPNGTPAACVAYERLLAASYDALKQVDPAHQRDRRRPLPARQRRAEGERATSRARPSAACATSARAYRGSARRRPIMDEFSFHPYPQIGPRSAPEGLPVAERGRAEPRPDQAGVLGRLQRHPPAALRRARPGRRAQVPPRRGRLAGAGDPERRARLRGQRERPDHRGGQQAQIYGGADPLPRAATRACAPCSSSA